MKDYDYYNNPDKLECACCQNDAEFEATDDSRYEHICGVCGWKFNRPTPSLAPSKCDIL